MKDLASLILAAGFGTRLRPLTETTPKALISYAGVPLLYLWLDKLEREGLTDIAINTHYLSSQLKKAIHTYPKSKDLKLKISVEKTILGTGGAIHPLRSWINDRDLLIVNSDIVTTTNLSNLIKTHRASNSYASMCLLSQRVPRETPIWVKNGMVIQIGGNSSPSPEASQHSFACQHILSPKFIKEIEGPQESSIIETYKKLLSQKKPIAAFISSEPWFDIGTPKNFYLAHLELLNQKPGNLLKKLKLKDLSKKLGLRPQQQNTKDSSRYMSHPIQLNTKIIIRKNFITNGKVKLPEDCTLENVLLLERASIHKGENISQMIVGENFRLKV